MLLEGYISTVSGAAIEIDGGFDINGNNVAGGKATNSATNNVEFGSTYDGSNHTGGIKFVGSHNKIVSKTTGTFLKAGTTFTYNRHYF